MAIKRTNTTDSKIGLQIYKNNTLWENQDGVSDLGEFVMAFTVEEAIDSPTIVGEIILQDAAGLVNRLTGSERWKITLDTGARSSSESSQTSYNLRAYNIDSRARQGSSEAYVIQLVSYEFLINESISLFGSSEVIFSGGLKSNQIVENILRGNATGGAMTTKNLFAEETQNDQKFISCNWRPFDVIYHLANRSIRKSSAGSKSQNGFIFWENVMGYHFKSIDQVIADINAQSNEESNPSNGTARMYTYSYQPKKAGDEDSDSYRIDSITYPEDRNFLKIMRNGSYAGFSTALDPSKFSNSKLSVENKQSQTPQVYDIEDFWNDMEHLDNVQCPVSTYDDDVKQIVKSKRRIRYTPLPNRLFDPKGQSSEQSANTQNLDELPFLDAYKHLRVNSFKSTRILINIPGNLDLYAGYGITINIPNTKASGSTVTKDLRYSGKYCIAAVKHKYSENTLFTELLLYKDGVKTAA
jgi:hypothetical protein